MQITQVAMCDFRSFQGLHEIDLVPRRKYGAKRPIVLFGGLNGAGKTSILTAVRLALYGKLILGSRASRKDYEAFLEESIHKNPRSLISADNAHVELCFEYGKLGRRHAYRIQRSWTRHRASVEERVRIWRDGELLRGVKREDAQAFLNELVPLGVSDLFFFDGEKIAELAEDRDGTALRDAIRRLIGIDVVERLRADLSVYLRRSAKGKADERLRKRFDQLQTDYESAKAQAEQKRSRLADAHEHLAQLELDAESCERELTRLGGRWAEGRASEERRIDELKSVREAHEAFLRELCGGLLPFALATEALQDATDHADAERSGQQHALLEKEIEAIVVKLTEEADDALSRKGADWLKRRLAQEVSSLRAQDTTSEFHAPFEASPREVASWRSVLESLLPDTQLRAAVALKALKHTRDELDLAGLRVERAPDGLSLETVLDKLKKAQAVRDEFASEVAEMKAQCREAIRQALQLGKEFKRVEAQVETYTATERPMEYGKRVRNLLGDYSYQTVTAKVTDLETEFANAFQRLARKEDMQVQAQIDPETYQVTLLDEAGHPINRNQLSAGERQIYAISMLEALAHTSGRRLPVIIDTPLGRLDSHHRANLVNHYFPRASHQVVILSTDTEVDQDFYADLSPDISHAFEINYDAETRSSSVSEGYFWRSSSAMREAS